MSKIKKFLIGLVVLIAIGGLLFPDDTKNTTTLATDTTALQQQIVQETQTNLSEESVNQTKNILQRKPTFLQEEDTVVNQVESVQNYTQNSQQENNIERTVYITRTGSKYHRDGCRYLSKSRISIDLSTAISQGYSPCKVCRP